MATVIPNADVPEMWKGLVKSLQRPSSSTLEAFLLPSDDARVHRAREDLASTTRENRKVTNQLPTGAGNSQAGRGIRRLTRTPAHPTPPVCCVGWLNFPPCANCEVRARLLAFVTDWGRCESRHQRARAEEALGAKRPLTGWEEGGKCKLPDFAWHDWGKVQVSVIALARSTHASTRATKPNGRGWLETQVQLLDLQSLRLNSPYRPADSLS
eukprot:580701-Pyramimonas_sp.AAC.1